LSQVRERSGKTDATCYNPHNVKSDSKDHPWDDLKAAALLVFDFVSLRADTPPGAFSVYGPRRAPITDWWPRERKAVFN